MRRRLRYTRSRPAPSHDDDPLAGVANLFDASLAFIVAMALALFSVLGSTNLFSAKSEWTLMRRTPQGELIIVNKQRNKIEVKRVSDRKLSGRGTRLGTAYRLPNGQVVYVPDSENSTD